MTVRLTLHQHGSGSLEIGLEIDDDAHVRAYQTSGSSVGRFARTLSPQERAALTDALDEAARAYPDPAGGPVPDARPAARKPSATTEQLVADDLPDATFDSTAEPPAGLRSLVDVLRAIRETIAASPVAAIELDVSGSPLGVRLRHVGDKPLAVAGTELTCELAAYDADYSLQHNEFSTIDATGLDRVGPGWSLDVVEQIRVSAPAGGFLSVRIGSLRVDSVGDGVLRQAEFSWVSE